ncbi:MAG: deoxyribodipyrimidine photo-lyase [Flavobacteriales bacterium]|nr:deoxyribodipyrimidine photo-lyase [Flavobacteriales bacterium]
MARPRVAIHWFRRDLRLHDNHGFFRALADHGEVLPLFIFDNQILDRLESREDQRVQLIHGILVDLRHRLADHGGALLIEHGQPLEVWRRLLDRFEITAVTVNHDHEPYAQERDRTIGELLSQNGVALRTFKDISIFERNEVVKDDGSPYTVCTPYIRKWRERFTDLDIQRFASEAQLDRLHRSLPLPLPSLESLGFGEGIMDLQPPVLPDRRLREYEHTRNLPGTEGTSRMSIHLRFGTVSVRELVRKAWSLSSAYMNELIWREFFMQVLWHFPQHDRAFKPAYDRIEWRADEAGFEAWCQGRTGYPLVDAGMRELLATGLMHNRVRMVAASFLCKHLLIDWRWGEAWFASKLLDFELSSNNGNWQWASGSGCDAAPYFRIFNPSLQVKRYDPQLIYVKRWVPELGSANYVRPMVVHENARSRALAAYQAALSGKIASTDSKNEPSA